ncbi:MAG: hypothetical protein PHV49_04665, partial [Alistipes sp.]|nr:hypothetical protein [Alistipes sp.]
MKLIRIFVVFCWLGGSTLWAQNTPLWQGKGRIVISCDGNVHDQDDWAAAPMMLALLASQGLQERLSLFVYSDHIWAGHSDVRGRNG